MAEKQAKKKEITEFKNFPEFLAQYQAKKSLPQVFIYVSTDSFEFDLITETYRNELTTSGEPLEVVVYVAETGDFEKLFSEMFNFSMFSSQKLLIIRSGADFFKSILTAGKKEMYDSFRRNIPNLAEKVYVLLHYDSKDIPAKLSNLFDNRFALLKNRNFYADERRPALEGILKTEKVHLEDAARDEFIHRIQPNTGAYIKAIRKLKLMLNKKEFTLPDIEEVLFNRAEFNPFQLVDLLFSNNKHEFFREFSKFKPGPESTFVYLSLT
jgi:DNA polymerase-3 subunit delta